MCGMVDNYNKDMRDFGYDVRGERGMSGRRYFVKFSDDLVNHTHHVHMYEEGRNPFVDEAILFRDYLRTNKEACEKYEKVKKELSEKFYHNPEKYTDGKHDCVLEILEEAKRYICYG